MAPRSFAWQACLFQHLGLDLRGRRGTFCTSIDVSGSLATNWVGFGAAGSCVAGVTLSAPQARFAWQAWYFGYLHRCPRKLGDEARFAWQAWYFRCLHRCPRKLGDELGRIWRRWILRGRRDAFSTSGSICVAGVVLSVPP